MASTDKKYVSAISLLDTKVILNKVVDIQNTVGLTDVMNLLGRYVESEQAIYHNYVNKPLWVPVTVNTVDAGDNTASVTVTITAGTSGSIRTNDECRAPDGTVLSVHSVTGSPNQLVLKTVDGSNWNATAADVLYVFSNSVGEESINRTIQQRDLTKYYNLIQIFRDTSKTTDIAKMSQTETTWEGKPYFYIKEYIELVLKVKAEANAAMIQGKISVSQFTTATNAITDPDGGGIKQFTRGLDQYIDDYGVDDTTDVSGTFDADDLGQHIDLLLAKKAELKFMMFGANPAVRKWDDYWKGVGSSGIQPAQLNVNGEKFNFNVQEIDIYNANIQKMNIPIMDHTDLTAADIRKYLYFLNSGKVKAQDRDGKTFMGDRIRMRYMKHPIAAGQNSKNAGNDIWGEWHSGAASPVNPVGETANAVCNIISYQGLEMLGAEHNSRLKVVA